MRRLPGLLAIMVAGLTLAACGTPTTPDTTGASLVQARQTLEDAKVSSITVTGDDADAPSSVFVCTQTQNGDKATSSVTLDVAPTCENAGAVEEDDFDTKKKKKRR